MRVAVEQRLGRHDLPVLAEAALRDLFVDPCLLQWMELTVFRQSFECCDLAFDGGDGRDTRPCRYAIDDHRACSALAESTPEVRTLQSEIIPQNVEQRSGRVYVQRVRFAVHVEYC